MLVRVRPDGSLEARPARGVVDLSLTSESAQAGLDGDVTALWDASLLDATLQPARVPETLAVTCLVPGLDIPAGSSLSLVARGEVARIVASVVLSTSRAPSGPTGSWQGTGSVTWHREGLAHPALAGPARLDLGVTVGRQIRSVGYLAGQGRPMPVTLGGTRWVMATSSNGRLLLVRGRAVRTRVGWALRRALPGRRRI